MSPVDIPQHDLSQVFATLQQSLYILFLHYKGYIKSTLLLILVYMFYKLGKISVKDYALQQKLNLSSLIEKRISIRLQIPKKLQQIKKLNTSIIIIGILLLIVFGVSYYSQYQLIVRNSQLFLTVIIVTIFSILTVVNIYKFLLNKKYHNSDSLQRVISKKLSEFEVTLGPKVLGLLKHNLCKDTQLKLYSKKTVNQCNKTQCKQIRTLYKTRNQALQSLVLDAMNFEWCSVCRKRLPFDEYLPFEFKQYQPAESQQQQIQHKMKYLMEGLDRMRKWLAETSPCNCAKLYWKVSTQKIVQYKQTIKQTESQIKYLENKSKV